MILKFLVLETNFLSYLALKIAYFSLMRNNFDRIRVLAW